MSGCAAVGDKWIPVIDRQSAGGKTNVEIQADLNDCQRYAREVDPSRQALTQMFAGIIGGAILGAAVGGNRRMANYGANVGGAMGVTSGTANGIMTQERVVKNCMNGRGYNVLN